MYGQHGEKGEREGWLFQLPWHGWKPGEDITGNTVLRVLCLIVKRNTIVYIIIEFANVTLYLNETKHSLKRSTWVAARCC